MFALNVKNEVVGATLRAGQFLEDVHTLVDKYSTDRFPI